MYGYGKHSLLEPPRIFGRRLHAFCLGDVDLLTALEHPALETAELTLRELAVSVWICSVPYERALQKIRSGVWLRDIRRVERAALFANRCRSAVAFGEYMDVFLQNPPRYENDKPVRPRVPWHLAVYATLQKNTNYTPAETWALPIPRAFELLAALGAAEGDESLIPPGEYPIWEALEKGGQ